ncbi:MAG: hypothetical protein ACOX7J_06345 [Bacillota bacterium]
MMKKHRLKSVIWLIMILLMSFALTACGSDEEKQQNNTTDYDSENLGFAISMPEELFSVITFDAYKEGYDSNIAAHKWKNTISAEFDGVSVPLFYVNVYDGEFDEKTIKSKFPDDAYLGVAKGFTYTMTFSVDGDGAALADKNAYQEMMDNYVYDLPEYTLIYGYGEALVHDADNIEPKLAWVRGFNTESGALEIDPVVMVIDGDEENIEKMKAAGITIDFSMGYMIWNEKEEQAEVTLSEDAVISLLDESFNFAESELADLQNRIEQGNLLISYLTENGKITQIYEQYQNVQNTGEGGAEE